MDGCASLFRCDKGMCADETSQCFAVAKAVIGISNGICNTSEHKSTFRNPHQYKSKNLFVKIFNYLCITNYKSFKTT